MMRSLSSIPLCFLANRTGTTVYEDGPHGLMATSVCLDGSVDVISQHHVLAQTPAKAVAEGKSDA